MEESKSPNTNDTIPSDVFVLQMVTAAWVSKTISEITRLNIPDLLSQYGAKTALQLTREHGVQAKPEFLERALRACASVGIFTENHSGAFGPTRFSEVLTSTSENSVKKFTELVGGSWWRAWSGLGDALISGKPQAKTQLGMEYWDYCNAHPQEMEDFAEAMKATSVSSIKGILERCDFSTTKTLVDIAGGFGHLALSLLGKYKNMQGIVLEIPKLVPLAKKNLATHDRDLLSRLEYVAGDMFEEVPPADTYIMKFIIHDWNDEQCLRILKNCHASMEGNGRIICVDSVLAPMGDTDNRGKFLDINMMVLIPGKERTEKQWYELFDRAGFKIRSIVSTEDNFGTSIIEGVKR